jgi:micrococcal nuclease
VVLQYFQKLSGQLFPLRLRSKSQLPLIATAFLALATGTPAQTFSGKVVGISDGDTIRVMRQGRAERIRLFGIDCPESRQAFGTKAKQFTSSLAFGRTVTVNSKGTDRYGRVLAEVVLPDGNNLEHEILRAGFGWWYRQYSSDPVLSKLESEARSRRRGLWADPHPISPWEYRKLARTARQEFPIRKEFQFQ